MNCPACKGLLELQWEENPRHPLGDNLYKCKSCESWWWEEFPKSRNFASTLIQIDEHEAKQILGDRNG